MPARARTVPNSFSLMLWTTEYGPKAGTLAEVVPDALAPLPCTSASRPITQFRICQLKPNWPPPATEFALALAKLAGQALAEEHGPRSAFVGLSAIDPVRPTPSIPSQPTLPPM